MTRKELESACRFMMTFESDMSVEDINKTFGVQLLESHSHEQALTMFLKSRSIKLDNHSNNKLQIAKEVLSECNRQVEKWGIQNHEPVFWNSILTEETGEAAREINDFTFAGDEPALDRLRTELVQAAAVCVSFIDSLDRNQFKERAVVNDNIRNS